MSKPTGLAKAITSIVGMLYLSAWLAFTAYLVAAAIRLGLGG